MRNTDSSYDRRTSKAVADIMDALRDMYGCALESYVTGIVEVYEIDITDLIRPDVAPDDVIDAVEERIAMGHPPDVRAWHVPPVCSGQIVESAFGCDSNDTIWERQTDHSTRRVTYHEFCELDELAEPFEPWNSMPIRQ